VPNIEPILARFGERVVVRRAGEPAAGGGCIVYWMQRAQRALDNPALDLVVEIGNALRLPVVVFFAFVPYPSANLRHYHFMQQGLVETARRLLKRRVGFVVRRHPEHDVARFCDEVGAALVVGDENPCREPRAWRERYAKQSRVPFFTVDADVVVPSKLLLKEQYSARVIRPRLAAQLPRYLVECANPKAEVEFRLPREVASLTPDFELKNWSALDTSVGPVDSFAGGTSEALRLLDEFCARKLAQYPERHGKPEVDGTSRLSPYLHFGQIGPTTVTLAVRHADAPEAAKDAFLDQLITWRELSINFVHFNPLYDSIEIAPDWAHRTLAAHSRDKRPVIYSREQLETAATGDPLWNAAQRQMLGVGWMHNYMRMYWAKKILEWSPSPAVAYQTALALNDKYFLDGRDPNGYAGIAWSIAGKFDRPWFERPVFGTVRYMSGAAAAKKFDAKKYIAQMGQLQDRLFA
jgi:deoxyribodipyrimidine photo-lyase